jgi:phage-related protein
MTKKRTQRTNVKNLDGYASYRSKGVNDKIQKYELFTKSRLVRFFSSYVSFFTLIEI